MRDVEKKENVRGTRGHGAQTVAFASHKRNPENRVKLGRVSFLQKNQPISSVRFVRQKW